MTENTPAPEPTRLAPGVTPENPPTHIAFTFEGPTGALSPLVLEVADELDGWLFDAVSEITTMISDGMADDLYDHVVDELRLQGFTASWKDLRVGDVFVIVWAPSPFSELEWEHTALDDSWAHIEDLPFVTNWEWRRSA